MPKLSSESDYTITALPNYTTGIGYYTSHTEVSDMLQVGAFTTTSVQRIAMIGKIIKRETKKPFIRVPAEQVWKKYEPYRMKQSVD